MIDMKGWMRSIAINIAPEILFDYRNHRRYCKKCGQQQDLHGYCNTPRISWWEDMGKIFDEKCECHKFQKYVR